MDQCCTHDALPLQVLQSLEARQLGWLWRAVLYCNVEIAQVQLVGKNRNGGREAGVVCLPCAITAIETGYITPLAFLKTGDRIVPRLFIEVQVRRIVLWAQQSLPYLHPAGLQIIRQTLALAGL